MSFDSKLFKRARLLIENPVRAWQIGSVATLLGVELVLHRILVRFVYKFQLLLIIFSYDCAKTTARTAM